MQDIKELDSRGIPGGFIASNAFEKAAFVRGEAIGFHPHKVFVEHPIQDRTNEELEALADDFFEQVMGLIVEN